MSLYDQVQQAQSPYMSQFVGSVVPELNQYAGVMNQRYNEAQDQDDMLSEALGNLHHLNFDADAQYANELKSHYYKRLQDRSARGDFENMGRRTRMDAMRFSQAYQPLIQRQQDMSELVKKINADQTISDPATKQRLIQKAMWENTPQKDPVSGDYIRDQNGRIQLQGIQDMQYAPDVDKNKIVMDLVEKKKAEIRQTGYTSDGMGHRVSTIDEVLRPESLSAISDLIQRTDPRIAAMINRDVDLQTYNKPTSQLTGELEASHLNKSDYQVYKKDKGLSDHDIAILAKRNGRTVDSLKQVPLQNLRQEYIKRGYSADAADRAIYNEQLAAGMRSGTNQLAAQFSVNNHKVEERNDEPWLINFKHNLDKADNSNIATMPITEPGITPVATNAHKVTTSYVESQQAMDAKSSNLKAAIGAALTHTGLSTGDPKKDLALIQQYANDPQKTAQLAAMLKPKNPDAADMLISTQKNYMDLRTAAAANKANTEGLEKASNIDTQGLYKQYVKDAQGNINDSSIPGFLKSNAKDILSYNDFLNTLRNSKDTRRPGVIGSIFSSTGQAFKDVQNKYDAAIEKGMNAYNSGGKTYHAIESLDAGDKFGQITQGVNVAAKTGALQIQEEGGTSTTLPKLLGLDPSKPADRERLASIKITLNRDLSPSGKLTASVNDGVRTRVVAMNNLDPAMESEINSMLYKSAGNTSSPEYSKSKFEDVQASMGEKYANLMPASELENKPVSTVHYPLNDHFTVQVKPGGELGKRYQVYAKDISTGKEVPVQMFNSSSDMYRAFGVLDHSSSVQPQRK